MRCGISLVVAVFIAGCGAASRSLPSPANIDQPEVTLAESPAATPGVVVRRIALGEPLARLPKGTKLTFLRSLYFPNGVGLICFQEGRSGCSQAAPYCNFIRNDSTSQVDNRKPQEFFIESVIQYWERPKFSFDTPQLITEFTFQNTSQFTLSCYSTPHLVDLQLVFRDSLQITQP
jgi:hypothetical protein